MNFNGKNLPFDVAASYMNEKIKNSLYKLDPHIKNLAQEIRVRVNKNISIVCPECTYFLLSNGSTSLSETSFTASVEDISEIIKIICNYSVYSYQNQIKNGFITLRGGHRVGLCGTAVISENEIHNIRDISSINVRIAKEIKGCANKILNKICTTYQGTLIVGPPSSGKTTVLRDIARQLSVVHGKPYKKIAIVDERNEIAAVYKGAPQFDVGLCDVLSGYPKGIGITSALRVLSPDIIICDEIGLTSEIPAIEEGLNAGVLIIASIHAGNINELINRKQIKNILSTGAFKNIILLNSQTKHTGEYEFFSLRELYDKNIGISNANFFGNTGRILCSN